MSVIKTSNKNKLLFFPLKIIIIETWSLLEHKHADWILRIVGDGPERDNIEHMVQKLELKNVRFEGFQYPRSYYEIASILILTSEY